MDPSLTNEQIKILEKYGQDFKQWIDTPEGKKEKDLHDQHKKYFREKLSSEKLDSISKAEFKEIWENTWASRIWGNKDYFIQKKLFNKIEIETFRDELKLLLYGSGDFEKRYDRFVQNKSGLGIATISEFLNMLFPDQFCLWNNTPKEVLSFLRMDTFSPKIFKSQYLKGIQYQECINYLDQIRKKLSDFGIKDFIDLDIFFWHILRDMIPKIWIVRAGKKGEQEQDALEREVITIGWNHLPDISSFQEKKDLIQAYSTLNPELKQDSITAMSRSIWFFAKEIKRGDIVLLPLVSSAKHNMAIAEVVGDYHYEPLTDKLLHTRKVKWLSKNIPISSFSQEARKHLGRPSTVYEITKDSIKSDITRILKDYGITVGTTDSTLTSMISGSELNHITIEQLVKETYFPKSKIEEIELLIKENKQFIFYGPPGTGKTFFAKKFAQYFTNGNYEIIQFHPSYSYEDFIEGIKPQIDESGGVGGFSKQEGLFKKLVKKCIKNPENNYLLIIDEINRGNVSRIFGELIYLLEYRGDEITLTYSPNEKFSIPENLYIIGTMNSADRSIAFVDYALRRRFLFFDFYPNLQNSNLLRKWFENNRSTEINSQSIITMLENINRIITDKLGREYQIGHSYFMKKNFDRKTLERTINYAILPLIEQYFFGKNEKIDEIRQICEKALFEISSQNSQNI